MEVKRRMSNGFSVQGAYTLARSIDLFSGVSEGASVPNVFQLASERGLSDFQAKHVLSASWIWDLPRLSAAPSVVRQVAGGWQLNGLYTARSGLPVNSTLGTDVALSGTPSQRPNVSGDPTLSSDRPRASQIQAWFNRTVFSAPPAGTYGDTGRNALLGPPSRAANLGLFKHFAIPGREGMGLEFRSEFFNAFNKVNLSNPNASLSAGAQMGRITSSGSARIIQFALKLRY
jgi:hypothetical protein